MKNVILIFLNLLMPLIYGDDDIKCEPNYGDESFTVCMKNSELVYVNQTKHKDTLTIGGFDFESIAPNAFQDLSIRQLELTLNEANWTGPVNQSSIQPKSFEGLKHVESLRIFRGIVQMEHNMFAALKSLGSLLISHCSLTFAKNGSFAGLPKLRELIIIYTKSFELLPGIFTGLDELRILYLYHNKFPTIRKNIFNHMKHLDVLDLGYSGIKTIEAGAFDGISVRSLSLVANELTVIPVGAFDGASIHHLELYFNKIVKIEANAFSNSIVKDISYTPEYITVDKKLSGLGESTILKAIRPRYDLIEKARKLMQGVNE